MHVNRSHGLTKQAARERIQTLLPVLVQQYGAVMTSADTAWHDDKMGFAFQALGYRFNGCVQADDSQVILDMTLPLTLRPFEDTLRAKLEEKLAEVFPSR